MSETERADWLRWARGRAGDALERGRAAETAGELDEARRWLERARRLASTDATIAVSLGGLLLRQGDPEAAARVLGPVADAHDLREAWSGLAVCALQRGRVEEAVAALGALLSRHAPDESVAMLAALVAGRAGLAGWCGVCADGRLWPAQPAGVSVALDGVALDAADEGGAEGGGVAALPAGWRGARALVVERDGQALLGSPLDVAAIGRVEGVVEARDGGLSGWAWHPADPDRAPALTVLRADGVSWALRADDLSITVDGAAPLSRPRGFAVAAAALDGLRVAGVVRVVDGGGRDLFGSPLDPGLEARGGAVRAGRVAVGAALGRRGGGAGGGGAARGVRGCRGAGLSRAAAHAGLPGERAGHAAAGEPAARGRGCIAGCGAGGGAGRDVAGGAHPARAPGAQHGVSGGGERGGCGLRRGATWCC